MLPKDVTSLIQDDSGTIYQACRANDCQNLIFYYRSLKHIPGQSLNTLPLSQIERNLTLV